MSEARRIADLHRKAYDGDSWHGPHVFDVLEGVDATRAMRKPVHGAHSIWEIVLHVHVQEAIVLRLLQGAPVQHPTPEEDWPPPAGGETAWRSDLAALRETHAQLNRTIEALEDAKLETIPPGGRRTFYELAHGAVAHALYHAGQIAILSKE
ncbi:MAG TPA: DinB family protein [Candidatus Eisenbacteria bacterium]|nr:DinB family protein [Candidatus Eisenbacteria bacterium]